MDDGAATARAHANESGTNVETSSSDQADSYITASCPPHPTPPFDFASPPVARGGARPRPRPPARVRGARHRVLFGMRLALGGPPRKVDADDRQAAGPGGAPGPRRGPSADRDPALAAAVATGADPGRPRTAAPARWTGPPRSAAQSDRLNPASDMRSKQARCAKRSARRSLGGAFSPRPADAAVHADTAGRAAAPPLLPPPPCRPPEGDRGAPRRPHAPCPRARWSHRISSFHRERSRVDRRWWARRGRRSPRSARPPRWGLAGRGASGWLEGGAGRGRKR